MSTHPHTPGKSILRPGPSSINIAFTKLVTLTSLNNMSHCNKWPALSERVCVTGTEGLPVGVTYDVSCTMWPLWRNSHMCWQCTRLYDVTVTWLANTYLNDCRHGAQNGLTRCVWVGRHRWSSSIVSPWMETKIFHKLKCKYR